eukprot:s553_g4.t1
MGVFESSVSIPATCLRAVMSVDHRGSTSKPRSCFTIGNGDADRGNLRNSTVLTWQSYVFARRHVLTGVDGKLGPAQAKLGVTLRASSLPRHFSSLQSKVDDFCKHVDLHLPKDGKKVVFATAWLATDNVFVLTGMNLVAIDTLHLFPTALECAKLVEEKYAKKAMWKMPKGITTKDDRSRDEFIAKYGDCEELDSADFDFVSKARQRAKGGKDGDLMCQYKVEPFQRALEECEKDILITGRRMDQAAQRIKLDVWEDQKRTLNPMANFSWQDIIDYEGVPVNAGHNWAFRCDAPIEATSRHLPDLPWTKVDLGKPFWRCTDAEIKGSPAAPITYVFKSFGDMHTTVPVEPHESERAGREDGDAATIQSLTASTVKAIELNERQACDVFCLLSGAFSPLSGFMEETAYNSVDMRLPEKQLFGLPVTFDLPEVDGIKQGDKLLLKWKGTNVAVLEASSIWKPNKVVEAKECYGTSSLEHPTVASLVQELRILEIIV